MNEVFLGVSAGDSPLLGVTLEYVDTTQINARLVILGVRSWAVTFYRGKSTSQPMRPAIPPTKTAGV